MTDGRSDALFDSETTTAAQRQLLLAASERRAALEQEQRAAEHALLREAQRQRAIERVLVREYNRGWQAGVVTGVVSVVTGFAFVTMLRR